MSILLKPHIDFPKEIIVRKFEGRVEYIEILNSWKSLKGHQLVTSQTVGIICDLSNCDLQLDMNDFASLLSYLKTQGYLKQIKLAVITDSPKNIVFPMLGETQEKTLQIKPFNTEKAAVGWIMNL